MDEFDLNYFLGSQLFDSYGVYDLWKLKFTKSLNLGFIFIYSDISGKIIEGVTFSMIKKILQSVILSGAQNWGIKYAYNIMKNFQLSLPELWPISLIFPCLIIYYQLSWVNMTVHNFDRYLNLYSHNTYTACGPKKDKYLIL